VSLKLKKSAMGYEWTKKLKWYNGSVWSDQLDARIYIGAFASNCNNWRRRHNTTTCKQLERTCVFDLVGVRHVYNTFLTILNLTYHIF
jgi:hypothetical protein